MTARVFMQRSILDHRYAFTCGLAVALWLPVVSGRAAVPQSPAPCATCAPNQVWKTAADIYALKQEFVAALRRFAVAITGTFGDEGTNLRANLDAMDVILKRWDAAIVSFEKVPAQPGADTEARIALGTVYLDRFRVDDALRELGAAVRLDARRADAYQLMALAHGLANRPSEAVQALLEAAALQPNDPVAHYEAARYWMEMGRQTDTLKELESFREAADSQLARAPRENAAAPFKRVGLLRQVAGVAPIYPPAPYVSAFQLLTTGAFHEAISEWRRVVESDPLVAGQGGDDDPLIAGSSALRRGDLSAALRQLRAATEKSPNRSEAHRVLGTALRFDEQFGESIESFNTAIQARPTDERPRIGLADVLIATQRFAEAEQVLKEASRVVPDTIQVHYRLGRLYPSLARYPEALQEFELAARFNPLTGQDSLYEMLAVVYVRQADFARAGEAFRRQLAVNPNNAEAHRRLGEVYVRQDRTEEALAEFAAALLIDPRSADTYVGAGQVHLRAGRYSDAERAARSALELDPLHKEPHFVLATSLLRLGRAESGGSELQEFQRLQAEASSATQRKFEIDGLRREVVVSAAQGDHANAIALLRRVVEREPTVASNYVDLGDALLKIGQTSESIENYEKARQLDPSDPDVHRHLAEAYSAAGQAEASRKEADLYRSLIEAAKKARLLRSGNP